MKQVQKPKKPLIFYYLIALAVLFLLNFLLVPMISGRNVKEVDYGTFLNMVEERKVSTVELDGDSMTGTASILRIRKRLRIIMKLRHLRIRIWSTVWMMPDVNLAGWRRSQ